MFLQKKRLHNIIYLISEFLECVAFLGKLFLGYWLTNFVVIVILSFFGDSEIGCRQFTPSLESCDRNVIKFWKIFFFYPLTLYLLAVKSHFRNVIIYEHGYQIPALYWFLHYRKNKWMLLQHNRFHAHFNWTQITSQQLRSSLQGTKLIQKAPRARTALLQFFYEDEKINK